TTAETVVGGKVTAGAGGGRLSATINGGEGISRAGRSPPAELALNFAVPLPGGKNVLLVTVTDTRGQSKPEARVIFPPRGPPAPPPPPPARAAAAPPPPPPPPPPPRRTRLTPGHHLLAARSGARGPGKHRARRHCLQRQGRAARARHVERCRDLPARGEGGRAHLSREPAPQAPGWAEHHRGHGHRRRRHHAAGGALGVLRPRRAPDRAVPSSGRRR